MKGRADCGAPLQWEEIAVCSVHGTNCESAKTAESIAIAHQMGYADGAAAERAKTAALDVERLARAMRLAAPNYIDIEEDHPYAGINHPDDYDRLAAAIASRYAAEETSDD